MRRSDALTPPCQEQAELGDGRTGGRLGDPQPHLGGRNRRGVRSSRWLPMLVAEANSASRRRCQESSSKPSTRCPSGRYSRSRTTLNVTGRPRSSTNSAVVTAIVGGPVGFAIAVDDVRGGELRIVAAGVAGRGLGAPGQVGGERGFRASAATGAAPVTSFS